MLYVSALIMNESAQSALLLNDPQTSTSYLYIHPGLGMTHFLASIAGSCGLFRLFVKIMIADEVFEKAYKSCPHMINVGLATCCKPHLSDHGMTLKYSLPQF